jgi:class 3 adenylate cyclase
VKKEEHIDLLFNCFQTTYRYRSAVKSGDGEDARLLKKLAGEQKARLALLCRELGRKGVAEKILAVYEMQPVYLDFCPPLVPQLIAQFLIDRRVRKNVAIRLRQLGKLYGKPFSMKPLHRIRWKIWLTRLKREYGYLIRFLKNFVQFHRDYQDYDAIRKAMNQINLTAEVKILNLSRVNNTLYEFLLPHERRFQEKPISSHVILKADVRGSTTITHRMMSRDLNPASYFSLNFFDPITEILPDYGAEKVFVEGDAIILSIFEREDDPVGRYSVARACGLGASILSIVKRYNLRNEKCRLPNIEIGIGITYAPGRPAFLFDGDQRIMISAAINIADRLSGCSKPLRQALFQKSTPFNLYVFQSVSDEAVSRTEDDIFLRYNVNGIELSETGFQKLQEEIRLRPFTVNTTTIRERTRMKFHTAKFPLVNGEYQRLVIREAPIVKIDAEKFNPRGVSRRRYYEICTNPKLRAVAENLPPEAAL